MLVLMLFCFPYSNPKYILEQSPKFPSKLDRWRQFTNQMTTILTYLIFNFLSYMNFAKYRIISPLGTTNESSFPRLPHSQPIFSRCVLQL